MKHTRAEMIEEFYKVLDQWITIYEDNNDSIMQILSQGNVKKIAIYGMGEMANHLLAYLRKQNIEVKYVIDEKEWQYSNGIVTCGIECEFEYVDIVIYTNYYEDEEKLEVLKAKFNVPIIYLGDIVFGNI